MSVRPPTLTDVARRVGVSAKTVSRVLNSDGPVAPGTRERVLAAVAELGFRPNLMARNMRVGSPDSTVGLVVPELGNPFFGTVAGGVERVVRERGLTLLVGASAETPEQERAVIASFLARRVSVLMVVPAPGSRHEELRAEQEGGLPLVFLDRPASGLTADSVLSENRAGARSGVAHLLAHGHRRIAFVGDRPARLHTRSERLHGYRAALAEAGAAFDAALTAEAHDPAAAAAAVRRLLAAPDPPTAVFAANNLASLGVVTALAEGGRRDVALVGFDDLPLSGVLEPGLTVIAQDPAALGGTAAELALRRLDGEPSPAAARTVPVRLIARGSGELPGPAAR